MKSLLPWALALILLGLAAFLYSSNHKLSMEAARLHIENAQIESLRAQVEQLTLSGSPAQAEQIAQLRKDNQELLRLRNEIRQLRDASKQLTQQVQQAQSQAQAAQSQVSSLNSSLQAAQTQVAQAQIAQAQGIPTSQTQTNSAQAAFEARYGTPSAANLLNACLNNLRQIDGAAQQWALENKKDANATPTAQDVAAYLKDGVFPKCPAGGTYTLHAVSGNPTCSITGHALPP